MMEYKGILAVTALTAGTLKVSDENGITPPPAAHF
jgi:hypothetical protein